MRDMTDDPSQDHLVAALRARAADPARRTQLAPAGFGRLRELFTGGSVLRPATLDEVRLAERELDVVLPRLLVRVYTEVADGGFGPGRGLLEPGQVVRRTRELRSGAPLPRGRTWPAALLPILEADQAWVCVDVATSAVVEWDQDDLSEHAGERRFKAPFTELSPSLEAWLGRWVRSKTAADRNKPSERERWARMRARAQSPEGMARQHRKAQAAIAAMTPEDRARWGLTLDADGPRNGDDDR